MPNYVTNEMHVRKDSDLDKFMTNLIKDKNVGVFDTILPMPKFLLEYKGDAWYYWRLRCWGTKWDVAGGDISREENEDDIAFRFDTAWSTPTAVIQALVNKHDGFINMLFADEDLGYNCGEVRFSEDPMCKNILEEYIRPDEDYDNNLEFAIKLLRIEDSFEIVDGKYVYKEEW